MGVQSCSQEISSPVAAERLFKALCLDSHNLFPTLMPQSFKSIEFVQGDCVAVGAVKQLNFAQGVPFKYVQHRIDELDVQNLYCKYTTTEGDALGDDVECCVHEAKFVASGGGCACTSTTEYHTKGAAVVDDERVRFGQQKMKGIFSKVEEYLLANPHAYT